MSFFGDDFFGVELAGVELSGDDFFGGEVSCYRVKVTLRFTIQKYVFHKSCFPLKIQCIELFHHIVVLGAHCIRF